MNLLLVAYDFPPIPSPQALRWAYMVQELAKAGHELQVIAPDVPGYGPGGLPLLPSGVKVHRVDPGRLSRLLLGRARVAAVGADAVVAPAADLNVVGALTQTEQLNWKGRLRKRVERAAGLGRELNWKGILAEKIKWVVSNRVFPDYRVEWVPHAVKKLDELVALRRPDAVIVSHEPACTLLVGLAAAERGLTLAVDMGDPVLAPYTEPKWRAEALALERAVCQAATLVSVTAEAAAQLLIERHKVPLERLLVVRQGYDPSFRATEQDRCIEFNPEKLELLYTGSFYSFRRAEELLDAVQSIAGVRLTVATIHAPDYLREAELRSPDSIRIVGFMPHRAALAAQRGCDVLVNIANADPVQIPGKIFEYLGASKPILHLRGDAQDATGQILAEIGAGWDIPTEREGIASVVRQMKAMKSDGGLQARVPDQLSVAQYSWPSMAALWSGRLQQLLGRSGEGRE